MTGARPTGQASAVLGNEAPRENAATMQCGHRTSTEPGRETICGASSGRAFARCRICAGVLFARCDEHGGRVQVIRLLREHEHECSLVHGVCRACFSVVVDREAGEELCPDCAVAA